MSPEDAALVRSLYAAFSGLAEGGDVASYVTAHYDPECEYQPVEEEATVRGHDALVRWNERWFEAWNEFHADVEEMVEAGDGVIVTGLVASGRGTGSGMPVEQRIFHVLELREGKVLRISEYLERDQALAAAGL
jgi:ketosteroid isomerase-like protein